MIKKNLNKIDISTNLSKEKGYSLLYSKKVINNLIEVLIDSIKESELAIKNIGNFKLIKKKQRIGRNPKTNETKLISSRAVVLFKPSKEFKEFINNKNDW